jgi:outer membrane PBP1 activator LpoA protein
VRRNDVDVIFIAANDTQARLLRPQLRFLDAGDIPVYATGRIYSGRPDPARNQDLDGVRFPATPWELMHTERDEVPEIASIRGGALGDLFAVGQDAWNVLPWLELMRKDPGFVFPGASGYYRRDLAGGLRREPAWAHFDNGRPKAVGPKPAESPQLDNVPRGIPLRPPTDVTDVAGR